MLDDACKEIETLELLYVQDSGNKPRETKWLEILVDVLLNCALRSKLLVLHI